MTNKCAAPYIGLFYKTDKNTIAPCCNYDDDYNLDDYNYKKVANYVNRKKQKECRVCWNKETYTSEMSLRNWFSQLDKEHQSSIDYKKHKPIWADIRTSNYCNLQCNMCSQADSSQIQSFVKKNTHMSKYFRQVAAGNNLDINIDIDFSNLKFLKLAGGEPTIDPYCIAFLDKFIKKYDASKVELIITTNATRIKNFFDKYKSKFKSLTVILSIDAVDEVYNLIRFPANWNTVKHNVDQLCTMKEININLNFVIQPYNILVADQWLHFISKFVKDRPKTKIDFLNCINPKHFSIDAMPDSAKQFVTDMLKTSEKNFPNIRKKISELQTIVTNSSYKQDYHAVLVDHLHDISKIRNIDYIKTIPEFKYLL